LKKIKVIVDSKIRIQNKDIPKDAINEIKKELTYNNSAYFKLQAMRKSTRGIPQLVRSYSVEKDYISFYRGSIYKVRQILDKYEITLQTDDRRVLKPYEEGFKSSIIIREYQKICVRQAKFFQNCLIQGGCGSGKTVILLELASQLGQHTLVVVPTEALLKQWIMRAEKFLGIPAKEIGVWGGGKKVLKPLTIGIINSVQKDSEFLADKFGAVLIDEVHRSPATMFQDFLGKSKAYYRIGATATPYRKDNLQCLMFDQFGKIVYEIKKEVLRRDGILINVDLIVVPTELEFPEYRAVDEDGELIEKSPQYVDLIEKMINDEDRNQLIYDILKKEYDEGHVNLVLSDRLDFCYNWQARLKKDGMESMLMLGGKKAQTERDRAIELLSDRKLRIGIGTSVADEGLDIPVLDRGFITMPTASNRRRIEQQIGRLERMADGKTDGKMYYFWDYKIKGLDNQINMIAKLFPNAKVVWDGKEVEILGFRKLYNKGKHIEE
jgi:superfamily II DNA or RNA helicase